MWKAMWGVTEEELSTDAIKDQLASLDESIKERISNQIKNDKAARKSSYKHEEIPEGLFDDKEEFIAKVMELELSTQKPMSICWSLMMNT